MTGPTGELPPRTSSPADASATFAEAMVNMAAIQRETLRSLERLKGGKPGGDGEGSDSDEYGQEAKFSGPRRLKRQVEHHPEQVVDRWLSHVAEQCASFRAGTNWSLSLYSEALRKSFGQNTGLLRVHHHISAILDVALLRRKPMVAFAMLVNLSQAVHQAGLDSGKWRIASTLVTSPDP